MYLEINQISALDNSLGVDMPLNIHIKPKCIVNDVREMHLKSIRSGLSFERN